MPYGIPFGSQRTAVYNIQYTYTIGFYVDVLYKNIVSKQLHDLPKIKSHKLFQNPK
jgi:hypothetical protein